MDTSKAVTSIPVPGRLITSILAMATISVLAFCLTRRVQGVISWKKLSLPGWLIIMIYVDSFAFVFLTAVLSKSWSLNQSTEVCGMAILLCLICYMTTKVLIYYFLVEKVFIIRGSRTSRFKNKLWLFNFFGVICPYMIIIVLNFVFRLAYINEKGVCIIGMKKVALVPLISFEVVLNVYLTSLFLHPLRQLYSYKQGTNVALRRMAIRTFVGSCATLASSVTNLSVLTILDGEPGWICLMLCNLDILFSVLVLHWATSIAKENGGSSAATPRSNLIFDSQRHASRAKTDTNNQDRRNIVMTNIEACKSGRTDNMAMDAIAVTTLQVQEIEVTSDSNEMEYIQRHGSEDAIVQGTAR